MGNPGYNLRQNVAPPIRYESEDVVREEYIISLFRPRSFFQNPNENKRWHPQDPIPYVEYNPNLRPASFPSIDPDEAARRNLTEKMKSFNSVDHARSRVQSVPSTGKILIPQSNLPMPSTKNYDRNERQISTSSATQQNVYQNESFGPPVFKMGREPVVDPVYSNCNENSTYTHNMNVMGQYPKKAEAQSLLLLDEMASSDEELVRVSKIVSELKISRCGLSVQANEA